jgi:hypothetical protein
MPLGEAREQALFERFERRLADAVCSDDPAAQRALCGDPELVSWLGSGLQHAHEDGFRIAALLVARLRFERLLHGSRTAGQAFEDDARTFTERFRLYHVAVPACATTPAEEAEQFEHWERA